MADAVTGFDISEQSGPGHAIARVATGITAFVGRALKGPVNNPVVIHNFAEYVRLFGGLWQPSTMSYALEQYFENGGRTAIVVRVANSARPPTITLPTGGAPLTLVGIAPGSREYLRASVDLDGIGENEEDRFNLVVQRVRTPGSERIEDQEIYRRLSVLPGSDRYVATVLLDSQLVRVLGEVPPAQRPLRTPSRTSSLMAGYVASNPDGDDGAALTDYDIIGSSQRGTGLFSLRFAPRFDLLCVPPLTRTDDVGLATLMVASRLCRERHAMLIVDPPASWTSAAGAVESLRPWPFRSEQALMYFPRVVAFDRVRGRHEVFASCGAAAGLIARGDAATPVWSAGENDEPVLRPALRPATQIDDVERGRLAQLGVNTFATVRPLHRTGSPRTLGAGGSGPADWTYLAARRLALFILASVEEGTRWIVFQHNQPAAWARLRNQVAAFLAEIEEEGAFVGRTAAERWFVICDERLNPPESVAAGKVHLLLGFAPMRSGDFHAFLVTHQAGSSSVRPVSVNRLATSGEQVEEEIETAILRGIALEA
ncbi:MAG TPA: hypothetical protein PKN91_06315 [Steroidobacteraceae bacterium]|nr:hypothetical protein [Steroidobacteraceae bacterium]